ncbi:hypothetical protein LCGC14_0368100 [marine sediment metagenome]|uniref:HNH nuclease domain-containing protein n=1 Tax=marine sediment metagenome TaxID=412755 RepID=A0A0F9WEC2_9ZZZZ
MSVSYSKLYYQFHKERIKQRNIEYRNNNKDKVKKWRQKRSQINLNYIRDLKMVSGCIQCGYNDNPHVLQFDHINPKTKFREVSSMVGYGRKKLDEEIAKCQILCANCHIVKTLEEQ